MSSPSRVPTTASPTHRCCDGTDPKRSSTGERSSLLPRHRLLSSGSQAPAILTIGSEWATDMKCTACGAEMHLIGVAPDNTMMAPGHEEHTFECSGCHDRVRRLVFIPRAIGPLTSQGMRVPPGHVKRRTEGASAKWGWVGAVGAVARAKVMYIAAMLILVGLAGSIITAGEGAKGPMGDQGPPGPKGPAGDPGAASGIRIVRSNCDETTCNVQCGGSEMLLTAYCGPKRNAAIIPTERAATCRATGPANSPLVAVCAQMEAP